MSIPNKKRQEFKVVLDGFNLSEEATAQIERSIQSAAMRELANFDARGDFNIRLKFPDDLETRGIWIQMELMR